MFDPAWITEYYDEWMDCEGKCDVDPYRRITCWWLEKGNTLYIFPPVCSRDFVNTPSPAGSGSRATRAASS